MALSSDQITPRFPFPSTATTLMVRRRDAPVGGALSEGAQAKIQSKNSLSPITPLVRVTFSKEVMEGIFSVDHAYTMEGEVDLSQNYFYCIIEDALACCAQGLEVELADPSAAYPQDYPAEGSQVRVVGTVELYEENGFRYLHLTDAVFE